MKVKKQYKGNGWVFTIINPVIDNGEPHSVCLREWGGNILACWGGNESMLVQLKGSRLHIREHRSIDVPAGPFVTAASKGWVFEATVVLNRLEVASLKLFVK